MSLIFIIAGIIIFILFPYFYKNSLVKKKTIAILPNSFIILGIIILAVCAFAPLIFRIIEITIYSELRNLLIIIGLLIICLSREKDENDSYMDKRFLSLSISFITVVVIYQFFLIFNFFDVRELSPAQFPILVLAIYILVFHWYKRKLVNL